VSKAGRNAVVTSLMVCCGFVVCWTPSEILFFLNFVGYPVDFGGWFYHFTSYQITPVLYSNTLLVLRRVLVFLLFGIGELIYCTLSKAL